MSGRRMNARIPVTDEVKNLVRAFADGAGVTYDDLLRHWLKQSGVDEFTERVAANCGVQLRGDIPVFNPEAE